MDAYRMQPGQLHYGFPCDRRGFYDQDYEKKPGETVVAAIGDSFSFGVVPHAYHYTTLCERAVPGLQVYNTGVIAAGPAEYLAILRDTVLPLEPDAVLVSIFIDNDVAEAHRFTTPRSFLAQWFDRDNLQLFQVPRRIARAVAERSALGKAAGAVQGQFLAVADDLEATYPWLAEPGLEQPTFSHETFLQIEADRSFYICRPEGTAYDEPIKRAPFEMQRVAGKTLFFVLLIPDEFQVEDRLWGELQQRPGRAGLDRDLPQRLLSDWLEDQGIPYLDLLPAFRAVPELPDGQRHLYHQLDTHWNRRGNEVAGRTLANLLAPLVGKG